MSWVWSIVSGCAAAVIIFAAVSWALIEAALRWMRGDV
jgi:hypothetical protein